MRCPVTVNSAYAIQGPLYTWAEGIITFTKWDGFTMPTFEIFYLYANKGVRAKLVGWRGLTRIDDLPDEYAPYTEMAQNLIWVYRDRADGQ